MHTTLMNLLGTNNIDEPCYVNKTLNGLDVKAGSSSTFFFLRTRFTVIHVFY